MTYTWQSVTKNIQMEDLAVKLDRRLDKIKTQLLHFPQNSVHLNISLEKNPKKDLFTAALTLHLPSNILHAEKSASHLLTAFDNAADTLVREIQSLKADLRGDYRWEQKGRRASLHDHKLNRFGGVPPEVEMDVDTETIAEMMDEQRERVQDFVRRQVERDETIGRIPPGELDVGNVVNTVAHRALAEHDQKPEDQTYRLWFYLLARDELNRRYRQLRRPMQPIITRQTRPITRKFDPPVAEPLAKILPDLDPAAQADVLRSVQEHSHDWSDEQKSIFDLRFFEAFSVEEIALIMRSSTDHVSEVCKELEGRVRDLATAAH